MQFFDKAILLNFIMDLSKDDHIRINLSQKKLAKGYNGFVISFIQMIYESSTTPPEIIQLIDSNTEWKTFLDEYFTPYLEKLSFELGGYHPRTKKETILKNGSEPEDVIFNCMKSFEENSYIGNMKANGWMMNGNGPKNISPRNGGSGYDDYGGEYDYYFEDSMNFGGKKMEENGQKHANVQNPENSKMFVSPILEEKNLIEEEDERNVNVEPEEYGGPGVMKCRYEYEEDYFFD